MEPFTIACPTCRARLKITSESAVGEIHPCPKCGSMVMVVPPRGWQASGSGVGKAREQKAESASPGASDAKDHASRLSMFEDDLLGGAKSTGDPSAIRKSAAAGAAQAPLIKTSFDDAASLLGEPVPGNAAGKVPGKTPTAPPKQQQPVHRASAAQSAKSSPAKGQPAQAPPVQKQPVQKQPVQKQPVQNPPVKQPTANARAAKQAAAKQVAAPNAVPADPTKVPPTKVAPAKAAANASAEQVPVATSPAASVPVAAAASTSSSGVAVPPRRVRVEASTTSAVASSATVAAAKPWFARWEVLAGGAGAIVVALLAFAFTRGPRGEVENTTADNSSAPAPAAPEPAAPKTKPEMEPAEVQPAEIVPAPVLPATPVPTAPAVEPKKDPPPAVVRQPPVQPSAIQPPAVQPPTVQPLAEKTAVENPAIEKSPVVAGPAASPMPIDPSLPQVFDEKLLAPAAKPEPKPPVKIAEPPRETDLLPKIAIKPVDVAARLKDKVAGIKMKEVPLVEFARLMSDLSTIPITLEPWALAYVGVSPRQPIALDVRDTNVEQILKQALAPLRLSIREADGQLIVTLPLPAAGKLRRAKYPLLDLFGNDAAKYEWLAEAIVDCIAPESWRAADTETSISVEASGLVVEQTEDVHFQIATLCDRLRVARGKPPASKLDPAQFKLAPRWQRLEPLLAKRPSVNLVRPTRLPKIFETLQKETKCVILVDWNALASAGWSAETETTLIDQERTLGELLNELLGSMQLVIRPLDENTLQVTTESALAAVPEVELYSIRDLVPAGGDGQALIERLQAAMPAAFRDGETKAAAHFDRESGCLLLSLPAHQQRQAAQLLGQMKAGK